MEGSFPRFSRVHLKREVHRRGRDAALERGAAELVLDEAQAAAEPAARRRKQEPARRRRARPREVRERARGVLARLEERALCVRV